MAESKREKKRRTAAAGVAIAMGAVAAAPAAIAEWNTAASVRLDGAYSDNITLATGNARESEWVTILTPRLSLNGTSARIKANVDYELSYLAYASDSERNRTLNSLSAAAVAEVVEDFFFVDGRASVGETTISAFGTLPTSPIGVTNNRTSVRTFSLSPYVRGRAPGNVSYDVRYDYTRSDSDAAQMASSSSGHWTAKASQPYAFGPLGWNASYEATNYESAGSPTNDWSRYRGGLNLPLNAYVAMFANAGRERNSFYQGGSTRTDWAFGVQWAPDPALSLSGYAGQQRTTPSTIAGGTNWGFNLNWSPTPRTSLAASREQRFFGVGYNFQFSHRFPTSALTLSASRDASTTGQQILRDVSVVVLPPQFAAIAEGITDPASRQQFIDFLRVAGIAATGVVRVPFVTEQIYLGTNINASYAIRGARNTVTLTLGRFTSESLTSTPVTSDLSVFSKVISNTAGLNWWFAVTPVSSLSANYLYSRNKGSGTSSQESMLQTVNLGLSSRLAPKTTGSLNVRHSRSDSTPGGYSENALLATLTHTF